MTEGLAVSHIVDWSITDSQLAEMFDVKLGLDNCS